MKNLKTFATWGLNQHLGRSKLALEPTGSQMNSRVQVSFVSLLQPTHLLETFASKITPSYKHKKLIEYSSKTGRFSVTLMRPENMVLNQQEQLCFSCFKPGARWCGQ